MLIDVDWEAMFVPEEALLEIFLRGTVIYLALFLLLRVVMRRQAGTVSVTDLLVVVLVADAAQNAMGADYRSIPEGLLLVGTIVFWAYALEWGGYRYAFIERIVHPPPLLLVQDGEMLRHNMRRELVTAEELMSQVRRHGLEDLSQVKAARLEGDGHISILTDAANGAPHDPIDSDRAV